jgi:rod shape-determining protein MreD
MKLTSVLVTVVVAVVLQMAVARVAVGGRWQVDLVLVGVTYAAIYWGPAAGILAGTVGGLLQDLLAHGIVGVGALVKTLIGFAAGSLSAQFIITSAALRMGVVAVATVVHGLMVLALHALIDQRWPGVPWPAMLGETVLNAVVALAAFQLTERGPAMIARRRGGSRSRLTRRQW